MILFFIFYVFVQHCYDFGMKVLNTIWIEHDRFLKTVESI